MRCHGSGPSPGAKPAPGKNRARSWKSSGTAASADPNHAKVKRRPPESSARMNQRDGAEPPLAAASVTSIENCFIKLDVDFKAASGWLQRMVRCADMAKLQTSAAGKFIRLMAATRKIYSVETRAKWNRESATQQSIRARAARDGCTRRQLRKTGARPD